MSAFGETVTITVPRDKRRKVRANYYSRRRGGRIARTIAFLLGTVWLLLVLAPFWYMLVAAFRTQAAYFTANPWLPGEGFTFANFQAVIGIGLGTYLRNSFFVVGAGVLLTLAIALMFAQHVVKHKTRAGSLMFAYLAIGLAVPVQSILVPLFILWTRLGLYDSLVGLIIILTAAALPLSIVIMTTFVRDIPTELVQAMQIDGAGSWTILWNLILPNSKGALGLLAIFNGLAMWNNLIIPLLFTSSADNALLPLSLFKFQSEYGANVPAIMMAVLLSSLPLIILFLATRKFAMQALGGMATMR